MGQSGEWDGAVIKETFGTLAIVLTFIGFVPYINSILANKTKPHAFSWIIWGTSTFTIFIAQIYNNGGAGSWSIGISGVITIAIAILAYYKKYDDSITKTDWIFLLIALSAIPCWYATSNALYAVIILAGVDIMGYLPTLRKAYDKPHEEQISLFIIMSVRNIFSIIALSQYSVTNLLFQVSTIIANLLVIAILLFKRKLERETRFELATTSLEG